MDKKIDKWRENLRKYGEISEEEMEELENHLLESMDELEEKSLSRSEAFMVAKHRLGDAAKISEEYRKSNKRLRPTVKNYILLPLALLGISLIIFYFLSNMPSYWQGVPFAMVRENEETLDSFSDEHLAMIEETVSHRQNDENMQAGAGYIFYAAGKYETAIDHLKKAHSLNPQEMAYPLYIAFSYQYLREKGVTEVTDSIQKYLEYGRDGENAAFFIPAPLPKEVVALKQLLEKEAEQAHWLFGEASYHYALKESLMAKGNIPPILVYSNPFRSVGYMLDSLQRKSFETAIHSEHFDDFKNDMYWKARPVLMEAGLDDFKNQRIISTVPSRSEDNLYVAAQYYFDDLGPFDREQDFKAVEADMLHFLQTAVIVYKGEPFFDYYNPLRLAFENLSSLYMLNGKKYPAALAAVGNFTTTELLKIINDLKNTEHSPFRVDLFDITINIILLLKIILSILFLFAVLGCLLSIILVNRAREFNHWEIAASSFVIILTAFLFFIISTIISRSDFTQVLLHILVVVFSIGIFVSKWKIFIKIRMHAPHVLFSLIFFSSPLYIVMYDETLMILYLSPLLLVAFLLALSSTIAYRYGKSWAIFWEATGLVSSVLLFLFVLLLSIPSSILSGYFAHKYEKYDPNESFLRFRGMANQKRFIIDSDGSYSEPTRYEYKGFEKYFELKDVQIPDWEEIK